MLIFTKIADLEGYLKEAAGRQKTIGFVPTMGALHPGHVSLIRISEKQCDVTICSIFVNPTQFNDKSDLERYPRVPEKDIALLQDSGCDALFMPAVEEIYPTQEKETFEFGLLNTTLEGGHRPGHFNGVAQVVKRFFQIIHPNKAFFGSKDYQQVMVVKELVRQMHAPIEIVACPILREPDGLAMSSRNTLLNSAERSIASHIPPMMQQAGSIAGSQDIAAAKSFISGEVAKEPLMKLDYYEICEAGTLAIVNTLEPGKKYVALIAVFVGRIRLIDNLPLG